MTQKKKTIQILLVDDHAMVREGVRAWLSQEKHLRIVGEASDGQEAISLARALKPDVILLDLNMPKMNGFEAALTLRKDLPDAALLALTVPGTQDQAKRLLGLGAKGYMLKDSSPAELIQAIETVAAGKSYIGLEAAKLMFQENGHNGSAEFDPALAQLTPREVEVLKLIAEARRTREIAAELGVTTRTVEKHRERVMRKLNISNLSGLTRYAIATGVARV